MKKTLLSLLLWFAATLPALAALEPAVLRQLADDDSDTRITAIQKLADSADPQALEVLKAMNSEALFATSEKLYIKNGNSITEALGGAELEQLPDNAEVITINNRVRNELAGAMAVLKLFSPDRKLRLAAARELANAQGIAPDTGMAKLLLKAREQETDAKIKVILGEAYALTTLQDSDPAVRIASARALSESADPNIKNRLFEMMKKANEPDLEVRRSAVASYYDIKQRIELGETVGRIFSGLSLGSILLLAALGLAITYGVMGVINMAHGELLMIGAYATYLMQSLFQAFMPGLIDWYVLAAIPVAFLCSAAVGVLLERTVIRRLYGRPLETLLATWGLSLILIQAARLLFGAQNVSVANPSWMSGGIELFSGISLPLNRLIIIGFALFVLALVWLLMNRTRLGLFVRAVTQNRAMAGCVGVPTARIDSAAFALGSGIAGLGGVALSQIANVGPDMGQSYIVDSFMVVVLGGVGQLAGTVWAALGLGIFTKFIEDSAGAVVAKIVVLTFIIIFIQKRPQGLFALKGRFVEN
jgi:urea transport system permease protein